MPEPRLLIYDGHLSHLWTGTLEYARKHNITIVKLPPYTTDLLQPLDVAVFKSVKDHWGQELFKRLKKTRSRLSKSEFSTLLSSEHVWDTAFSEENIKKGFEKCGIFPCNKDKYPVTRFNKNLKNRYDAWVTSGKKPLTAEELDEMTPSKMMNSDCEEENDAPSTSGLSVSDASATFEGKQGKVVSYFVPDDNPSNMVLLPSTSCLPSKGNSSASFKELFLKKLDQQSTSTPKPGKRRKVNPYGAIVTADEQFQQAIEGAEKKKGSTKKQKSKKIVEDESDTDQDIEMHLDDDSDASIDLSDEEDDMPNLFPPTTTRQCYRHLQNTWKKINPPVTEEQLLGKFFAGIYIGTSAKGKSKKANMYVGKVKQRYLHDADGPTILLKLDCLKPAVGSTTLLEEIPSHLPRDIGDFEAHNIIAGPLEATPEKGKKWAIKFYPQVHQTFEHVVKLNREEDYNKLFPKTE